MNRLRSIFTLVAASCALIVSSAAEANESPAAPDAFFPEMVSVPAGEFVLGSREEEEGESDEQPRTVVRLSAYEIGRFEITNVQFAGVLNWALMNGLLENFLGEPYEETGGDVYYRGKPLKYLSENSAIVYWNGMFDVSNRDGLFMEHHPVVEVTWFGAVACANWMSEMAGLRPCYDEYTWERLDPVPNGYRLPTEAEWERAAAWDSKADPQHWIFGFESDTIDASRANFDFANPLHRLGLQSYPQTTPIGYYNGSNPGTLDSSSTVGCYDMSGNVHEWCHDWFGPYTETPKQDPSGPAEGLHRVVRGGGWSSIARNCRTANRGWTDPAKAFRTFGFRLARNAVQAATESASD